MFSETACTKEFEQIFDPSFILADDFIYEKRYTPFLFIYAG